MKISQRAQSMGAFHAMEFAQRAAQREAQGRRVIKLCIGEPDFGAPPAVLDAMRTALSGPLPYTSALGLPALREAIAGFYAQMHGAVIDPQRVIITSGASAALLLMAATLVDEGDEVLIGDPSYPCNRHLLSSFGARVNMVPTTPASRFQLDAQLVRDHWTADTRGLLVATPSNPTGTSIPTAELAAICQWARERDAWCIIDEIYLNLADPDELGQPPATALAVDDQAIVINSFSKYFGMTGWRLGWCVVPPALVEPLQRMVQNYYICPSTPAQIAALACFSPQSLAVCEQRRAELVKRRQLVLAGLQRIGLQVDVPPDGAFYVYVNVGATGLSAWEFCERALEEVDVALTPGLDFGHCSANDHVRLSYAASTAELEEGIERLGRFVAGLR